MITKLPNTDQANRLTARLKSFQSLAVAFSGGVDSTLLLTAASQILPGDVVAMISTSRIHPEREIKEAFSFLKMNHFQYVILNTDELNLPDFVDNSKERCYHCKYHLFEQATRTAKQLNIERISHGANMDDLEDERPGFRAAGEFGIKAPLIEAGLTKAEIRKLSEAMNLPTWNKPAMACLATRIPTGVRITERRLKMIERAEEVILSKGFTTCRARIHDGTVRIELIPDEIHRMFQESIDAEIALKLKAIGFEHISVDIEGYGRRKKQPNI